MRAGNKGFATSINRVIDDGTRVKPGQLLMELDDSALKDQEVDQDIKVRAALATKVKAETDLKIAVLKHTTAVATAQADLTVKEIDLDKLTGLGFDPGLKGLAAATGAFAALVEGGSYRQTLDDMTGQISLAQANVEQNRERAAWADRMVKLTYMSAAQAQAEKSRLDSSVETLRSLQAKKNLLISHDRRQQITDLTSKRDNARRALEQADLEGKAAVYVAEEELKKNIYLLAQEQAKLEDIQDQRRLCKIHAPDDIEDGSMVVYFKSESSRGFGGSSSNQGMIEQGAQVKEGQKMLRIPNLSKMQVNTKVHEAMVSRIRGDVRVPTRLVEYTQAALLFNTDHFGRLFAFRPEVADRVRDEYRQKDPQFEYKKVRDGQRALIRMDSLPGEQFLGHVQRVAAVASQTDSWISDVKLYQTLVRIEGKLSPDGKTVIPLEGEQLKPDMTAEVTITVDTSAAPVLTVPLQAIIGGAEMGGTREVFVKVGTGYERRSVTLGLYNETMVEIRTGLSEGDEVVTNPKVLLGDKDKVKTREAGDVKGDSKAGEKSPGEAKDAGGPGANGPGGAPGAGGEGGKKFGGKKGMGGGGGGGPGGGGGFQKGGGGGPPAG